MTKPHKPGCMANMNCAVYHPDGVCPGPYGKCICDSLPAHEMPECTCTATHEGPCQDSRAEKVKRTAIIECDYESVVSDGIPYGGQLVGVKAFCTTCERPVMHEGPDPRAEKPNCYKCDPEGWSEKMVTRGATLPMCQYHYDELRRPFQRAEMPTPETPREEKCCQVGGFEHPWGENGREYIGKICDCHCHTTTPRAETWEGRFDEKFGKNGGYLCQYDGKATYTSVPEEVKSFIASEIQSAVEAERRRIADEVNMMMGFRGFGRDRIWVGNGTDCVYIDRKTVLSIINPK